ncbi:cyclic nucleotide-binding domain-containing protein, partial [Bauldia litoralis]|uniref:cyclic nucleotide-binding domain-containing protein n=1 Tax=Bauldia litoralis TaxID=665467 RepID=UPI0032988791
MAAPAETWGLGFVMMAGSYGSPGKGKAPCRLLRKAGPRQQIPVANFAKQVQFAPDLMKRGSVDCGLPVRVDRLRADRKAMITVEELAAIPLFATLQPSDLAQLAQVAADIRLGDGEYVVHEGEEPSFLLVLSGKLDVMKLVDGIERKIGERAAGKMHGEIPLMYGSPFQAGGRAAGPTRVMKVSSRQFHAIADTSPEITKAVGDLARERLGGLRGIA